MTLFIGLKGNQSELNLPSNNVWCFPSWDHDQSMSEFRGDNSKPYPFVFMSFPSAKDPSYEARCPGKYIIFIIIK